MTRNRFAPVLTYHAVHVDGNDYANNDHLGLVHDLELIHALGWQVIPARYIVKALLSDGLDRLPARSLALTFDDGSWFDWYDLPHPRFGLQRGFAGILRDFRAKYGLDAQPGLHATSFVIVSSEARDALDRACMIGQGWWTDVWWSKASKEGLLAIANHSWDHRHPKLPESLRHGSGYGNFLEKFDKMECDWQVQQSQELLAKILWAPPEPLFAYPFGETPKLLARDYFPRYGETLGLIGAFATIPEPVTADSDPWRLPRFVFRRDWHSPEELRRLLGEFA